MKKIYKSESLSGEIRGIVSELLLKRDSVTATTGVQNELTNVVKLLVLVSVVHKISLDASSDDVPSQKVVASYVNSQVSLYSPLATPMPFKMSVD